MDQDYEPNMPYVKYGVRLAFSGKTGQDIHAGGSPLSLASGKCAAFCRSYARD